MRESTRRTVLGRRMWISKVPGFLAYTAITLSMMWAAFSSFLFLNARFDLLGRTNRHSPKRGEAIPEFQFISSATGQCLNSRSVADAKCIFAFLSCADQRERRDIEDLVGELSAAGKDASVFAILIDKPADAVDDAGTYYSCDDCQRCVRVLPSYWFAEKGVIVDVLEGKSRGYGFRYDATEFLGIPQAWGAKVTLTPQIWRAVLLPDQAYRRAWEEEGVQNLFRETLERGSTPMTEVQLAWDATDSSMFYQVVFLDRVCPCSGHDVDAFNVARVTIDPLDGSTIGLDIREGIAGEYLNK